MISVKIPATTTNYGPGFDCLGMALTVYNEIDITPSEGLQIMVDDPSIPTDRSNLIYQAMERAYERTEQNIPGVRIVQRNAIPLARGMGSSAACIVGGITAANALMGNALSFEDVLQLATEMDGHPDNVLPALVGGLCAASMEGKTVVYNKLAPHEKYAFLLIIPDYELPTKEARKVLPASYSRSDSVSAVGRAVLMTTSLLNGESQNLKLASQDILHQPYRKKLMKGFDHAVERAYYLGAHGVYLSGAGSTIAAIVSGDVDFMMKQLKKDLPEGWKILLTHCDHEGVQIKQS